MKLGGYETHSPSPPVSRVERAVGSLAPAATLY